MVDLPNIKNYPKETKRIYLIICIFAAFLNKRLANKMKKGLFYAILASILWAIVNPFIKQGLSYDFTPMNFAGIRFTTVGIILFAYTWHKGMWREIRQHSKLFLNLILINMFMGYTAFYFGVDFVSGAISSIIMGMTPLINVLLAHLLASNDRLNTHKIISLIVSLIGLFLIIGMGSNGAPLDWKGITGIVLLLLSIIFQGYSAISGFRRQRKGESYFPECGADVLRRSAYIYGRLGHGRLSFFYRKTRRILCQPCDTGIHICIRLQLLVYRFTKQRRQSQRHQYVPVDQSDSGCSP